MFVPSLSWYNHRFLCIHGAKEQHTSPFLLAMPFFAALKTINFTKTGSGQTQGKLREKGVFCRLPGDDPAEAADDVPARSLRGQRLGDPDGAQRPLPFI
jgi:hypothetical protein